MPDTHTLAVRPCLRRDIPLLAAIGPWDEAGLLRRLRDQSPRASCLVAEVDGVPAGHATFAFQPDHLVLLCVAVAPAFRRRRLGTVLVDAAREYLHGRLWVDCLVSEDDLPGQLFLRNCGFKAVHVHRDWMGDGRSYYQMEWKVADGPED